MNIAQVKAKARSAATRREDEIEQEEIEGGEINLVPYLDIVTNLMLFMLASVATVVLGQINTTLPSHSPANAASVADPAKKPDEQPLQLVVSVTPVRMLLWSISGLEGTIQDPKMTSPSAMKDGSFTYDYMKLNDALFEIANRRYKDKIRPVDTYDIMLQVDNDIPYNVVIETMDHLRRRIPKDVKTIQAVAMPKAENVDNKPKPIENYDPEKHFLFPDILFAKPGFE